MPHIPMEARKWIYMVALAAIALLITYDLLSPEQAPVWSALIAALLGLTAPALALSNLKPDTDQNAHWEQEREAELAELEEQPND